VKENISLNDHIVAHCNESMEIALSVERHPLWARSCPEMSDIEFIRFGLLRCIGGDDSGRDFLQTRNNIHDEPLPVSTYFNSLKSPRRMRMLEAIEKQSYNTEKGENGKVYAAGFIYAMNLRNGLLKPLCCVTNGTKRNQEIPALRNYIEKQNKKTNKSEKCLYVYDKAVTDYLWWDQQKRHESFMISVLKENSAATFFESIPFDSRSEVNVGIEGYSIYENGGIKFSLVEYRDPETQTLHRFVTTLPTTINPGTIAILYFKRWTIEKAFNNSKSNLKEKKAWSSDFNALKNQMRLTSMTYNQMRIFEEVSKIQDSGLMHPSDKK